MYYRIEAHYSNEHTQGVDCWFEQTIEEAIESVKLFIEGRVYLGYTIHHVEIKQEAK